MSDRSKHLQAVGRYVADYYYTAGECLICDVDSDDVTASGHRPWCPVGHLVESLPETPGRKATATP